LSGFNGTLNVKAMCGIAGILEPNRAPRELTSVVGAMAEALLHRGPDDHGIWVDASAGIALGHRRLSIVDLSPAGHQPMVSGSGRYVISYNGEVYNHDEIRRELILHGYKFRGRSDTEVMLAAIEVFGLESALSRFIGMFAFALWDRSERVLSLARDRLGIKPVYWTRVNGRFMFASELKAFAGVPGWAGEVDPTALAAFLRWSYVPGPETIFRHVQKLMPGTILKVSANTTPRIETYWDLHEVVVAGINCRHSTDESSDLDQLDRLISAAVARRMVADVPLGAFLSGGIDSSLIVAMMQEASARPVRTFAIGSTDPEMDESGHARAVADHLRTDHTEYIIQPRDALDIIPDLPQIYDEPFADPSQIPTFLVSRMTRSSVTVALSGDGGDELFAGYTRYSWADWLNRRFFRIPTPLRRTLAYSLTSTSRMLWHTGSGLLSSGGFLPKSLERLEKLGTYIAQPTIDDVYFRQHTGWETPSDVVLGCSSADRTRSPVDHEGSIPMPVDRMQYRDMITYLPDDILSKVDRASMAVGLEVRVPLLDHNVVEAAWRLPFDQKWREGKTKWALRQLLYRRVPRHLVDRRKAGFAIPIAKWLRGPLIDDRRLRAEGFLDVKSVHNRWKRLQAGNEWDAAPIWSVLMFQAWNERRSGDKIAL
jgi:asparagine synthase (glutamine-hydrolysing)